MNRRRRLLIISLTLPFAISACNLPSGGPTPTPDLPGTITAQALTLQAKTSIPPTETAISGVEVSVTTDSNCRTGPSQAFDLILTAYPGQTFKVVGKNTPTNYWIINNPAGGTCWLWGRYAVLSGDTSTLPEYPAPPEPAPESTKTPKPTKTPEPTATISKPSPPSGLNYVRTCEAIMAGSIPKWFEGVTLSWQDTADNEQGFGVYQNDLLVATQPKNSTGYYTSLNYNQGTGGPLFDKFAVEAYNITGSSARPAVDVPRCP